VLSSIIIIIIATISIVFSPLVIIRR
jgi:hypothetical protein